METYINNNKKPEITVIIPSYNVKEYIEECLESLKNQTFTDFEVLCVDDGSNDGTADIIKEYAVSDPRFQYVSMDHCGKAGLMRNEGIKRAQGEYLLFLNNDIKVITPEWMDEMLGVCQRPEVGAVGVKLIYPDNTIQHAGCVVGMGGIAGHMFVDMPAERTGYLHKASLLQDMSAVTAACMMMKKEAFDRAGGFTQELAVAFNDVDLCLKVRKAGYLIVYDPYAKLYHMESKTRGAEDSKEKVRRFQTEIEYMRCRWLNILKNGDPYYNKNLSLTKWNYSLKPLPGMETKEKKTAGGDHA